MILMPSVKNPNNLNKCIQCALLFPSATIQIALFCKQKMYKFVWDI